VEFFQIHVDLWVFVLSQILGLIYVGIVFYALQIKDKSKTLKWYAIGNIFTIISNALLLNFVIVGTKSVSFFKNISFSHLQKNRGKVSKLVSVGTLVFFITIAFVVGIFTWNGLWFNWLIISALAISYFSEWHENVHLLRFGMLLYVGMVFVNALMFFNIASMIECIITLIAVIVFYVRYIKKRKQSLKEKSVE